MYEPTPAELADMRFTYARITALLASDESIGRVDRDELLQMLDPIGMMLGSFD